MNNLKIAKILKIMFPNTERAITSIPVRKFPRDKNSNFAQINHNVYYDYPEEYKPNKLNYRGHGVLFGILAFILLSWLISCLLE